MFNSKLFLKISLGITALALPALVIGGYFGMSNINNYLNYYKIPVNDTPPGYILAYKSCVRQGAEIIVSPGFTHKDPIISAFNGNKEYFKNTGFMLLDEAVNVVENNSWSQNTVGVTFRSDLSGFRTAISAGMLLNDNQKHFLGEDNKLTYGTYGGAPYSSVTSFMGGFQKGIEWFNKNLEGKIIPETDITIKKVEQINVRNDTDFGIGFGPGQDGGLIKKFISKNVDIFMPVAGPQIWDAQNVIISDNKKTVLIGVDSASEDDSLNMPIPSKLLDSNFKGANGSKKIVQMSAIKDLALATDRVLNIINNGNKIPEGAIANEYNELVSAEGTGGFGTNGVGNILNGMVGVSPAGIELYEKSLKMVGATINQSTDPSLDPSLSVEKDMFYTSQNEGTAKGSIFNYGEAPFGIRQKFEDLKQETVLSKKDFVKSNKQSDSGKIKIVLSGSTSILMDGSFSQSCYTGMYNWFKGKGITIPPPKGVK